MLDVVVIVRTVVEFALEASLVLLRQVG